METPHANPTTRGESVPPVNETIESLLVAGLDRYFAGDCDGAIHAWTRVLFLDRRHARARAYIERARRVLAERQRHADELAQRGADAFQAGETTQARSLLTSAMAQGAHDEPILAMIDRIDRLTPQILPSVWVPRRAVALGRAVLARQAGGRHAPLGAAVLVAILVGGAVWLAWPRIVARAVAPMATAETHGVLAPTGDLPLPRLSTLVIARARGLFERGHAHEALEALGQVPIDDTARPEADRLKADVQRTLLVDLDSSRPQAPTRAHRP
jgi:hypothetical protein